MEFHRGEVRESVGCYSPQQVTAAARVVAGNAGDHKLVYALLRATGQAPAYEEFVTWLDEPTYGPHDRLLLKLGDQIIAQLQVRRHDAWYHGVNLPVASLECLAILPEYLAAGHEHRLLVAAEQAMRDSRAVVAFTATDRPTAFRARGWSEINSPGYTEANVHEVLAQLPPPVGRRRRRGQSPRIRNWRQVELEALSGIYREFVSSTWGGIDRSEAYWRWLVGRNTHDELIVAIDGPDEIDSLETLPHMVGYAVRRGSRVLELSTLGRSRRAAELLLARSCQDAIERDHHTISLNTPPDDPLHRTLINAGGNWSNGGGHFARLAKVLDPAGWVAGVFPVLRERATAVGLALPLALTFDAGPRRYRLDLTPHSSRLTPHRGVTSDVICAPGRLEALLVGNVELAAARELGELEIGSESAAATLAALFPPTMFWQSQLDALHF